ncbi:aminoglycoside phosphotransferase family protein [Actinoplanes sp. NPDC024001]|uniref:aminoglycoside phosphotransferase family protein n=1 Tax=Actinoplanes sp. NPDC024001 TaxID=3154598 RepID=UPI0033FBF98F
MGGDRLTVPEAYAAWRGQIDGEAGREWVRALPALVRRLAGRWGLSIDDAAPLHGAVSLVVLVHRGTRPLVLRVAWPDGTNAQEALALRAWRGRGVVELVDADPESGALLLERLDHTRTLHSLPVWEAAEIAGALIRTLAVEPPDGLVTLREVADGIHDGLGRRQRALGDPVPPAWVERAVHCARELRSAGEQRMIHADLHYGNVLAGTRETWLAVDPRPLRGAPEYAVPELIWNRADQLRSASDVRRLLEVIVRAGRLDAEIAVGWVVTRCVDYWLWGVQRGLTIDPARCARVLSALLEQAPGTRGT